MIKVGNWLFSLNEYHYYIHKIVNDNIDDGYYEIILSFCHTGNGSRITEDHSVFVKVDSSNNVLHLKERSFYCPDKFDEYFFQYGVLHRDDGPAEIIYYNTISDYYYRFYYLGELVKMDDYLKKANKSDEESAYLKLKYGVNN